MRLDIRNHFEGAAIVEPIRPRRAWDWVLTGVLAVIAIASIAVDEALPIWARVMPALVGLALIPFRRQIPLAAVLIVNTVAAGCVVVAVRGVAVNDVASPAVLADVVLFYALCRWSTPVRVGAGLAATVAADVAIVWATGDLGVYDWIAALPWLALGAFALAMRYRARAIAGRFERVRLEERNALARELHDSVAHHVSAIAVQAQAGQYVIGSNPEAATKVLESIAVVAHESIEEMRRMIGVLRSDASDTRTVAPDSLDVLATNAVRPSIHVRGETQLDELPGPIGAALFRIAQESITNARQHSREATFVEVTVERHDDRVVMIVDNDGMPTTRNAGSGYGQVGMHERAEALGGQFESGALPVHGWRTTTSIPLTRTSR